MSLQENRNLSHSAKDKINQTAAIQANRTKIIKILNKDNSFKKKSKEPFIANPGNLEWSFSQYLSLVCAKEHSSFCIDNPSLITPTYIHKIRKTNSISKSFPKLDLSSKTMETIKRLTALNNLTYQQERLYYQLDDIQVGTFNIIIVKTKDKSYYYDEYSYSLTKIPTPASIAWIYALYIGLNVIIFIAALLFSLFLYPIIMMGPLLGFVSSALWQARDIMNSVKLSLDNNTGTIVFQKGKQVVENKNQWDVWQTKLNLIERQKLDNDKANENKLNSIWGNLNKLTKNNHRLQEQIKLKSIQLDNLNSNLNNITLAIKQLPITSALIKEDSLELHLVASLKDLSAKEGCDKNAPLVLQVKTASLKQTTGWVFSLTQDEQMIVSNEEGVISQLNSFPQLKNKLLLLHQTAGKCQARFFTVLNSALIQPDNKNASTTALSTVQAKLEKELAHEIDELSKEQERNLILQDKLKEQLVTCVTTPHLLQLIDLGQDRAALWFKQLTDASNLASINKIEASFNNIDELCITLFIKAQNVNDINGNIYRLEAMSLYGRYRVDDNRLTFVSLVCKKYDNEGTPNHPHILHKGNRNACLGYANEPLMKAIKRDDLSAMIHILANWSSTVSESEFHQRRLRSWCEKMPATAPLGIIEDESVNA